jgi:hypothetical protein
MIKFVLYTSCLVTICSCTLSKDESNPSKPATVSNFSIVNNRLKMVGTGLQYLTAASLGTPPSATPVSILSSSDTMALAGLPATVELPSLLTLKSLTGEPAYTLSALDSLSITGLLDVGGHMANSQATGTLTLSACGNGVVQGNDTRGTVNIGSVAVTSCTVNFSTAFSTPPYCVVSSNSNATVGVVYVASTTTTTMVLQFTQITDTAPVTYICLQ